MDQQCVILGIFWLEIWLEYCHIWYEHPPIFIIAKIRKNQKYLSLAKKKLKKMSNLGILGLEIENNFVMSQRNTLKFV